MDFETAVYDAKAGRFLPSQTRWMV